jgi:cytochrome c biogenesis protein CcmG/thiol:disulfide interchange protein DsbE
VRHPARWIALAVAAAVVVFGVVLALNVGSDPQAEAQHSPLLGRSAPHFDLPGLSGGRVTRAELAGKSVIVNFWNTWCLPCREELPALKEFYASHANDSDVVMIGIVRDDTTTRVRSYVREQGIAWDIALDPGSRAALDFATRGQPETLAISPSGQIVASKYSVMTIAELDSFLSHARAAG